MAYQIGRIKRVQEVLELVDDNGAVVHSIAVDLDTDRVAAEFNRRYNTVIAAEKAIRAVRQVPQGQTVPMTETEAAVANEAFAAFGSAIVSLFSLIFGDDGAQTILDFYDGRYTEMALQVTPFVVNVVLPTMQACASARQKQLAEEFKLNRAQQRRMGL